MIACTDETRMDEPGEDEAAATNVELRLRLRSNGREGGSGTGALDRRLEWIGSGGVRAASAGSAGAAPESTGAAGTGASSGGWGGSETLATWTGGGSG